LTVEKKLNFTMNAQRDAFRLKLALGLLNPFSRLNSSVRLGQLAWHVLSRWAIKPLPPKPPSGLHYLTIGGRAHWLMLRESLFSLYLSWKDLPLVTAVSDGSWSAEEFNPVFAWWPGIIEVLTREQVVAATRAAGEEELGQYATASPYGLKLAAIVHTARQPQPMLFVDADILWFKDPAEIIGASESWGKPRGVQEGNCYQRREIALRYCPQVMEPPFVNGGILALQGEFLETGLLRRMVSEALADPKEGSFEQTIIATAVHKGAGFLPEKLCLVEFDDVHAFSQRNMVREGYYSRHYVNWMRHLLYRDALKLRWQHPSRP
jgi:hypothetical protein